LFILSSEGHLRKPSVLNIFACRYGATLFGVERAGEIRVNPGNEFTIEKEDVLFYLCLTGEEDALIMDESSSEETASKSESGIPLSLSLSGLCRKFCVVQLTKGRCSFS